MSRFIYALSDPNTHEVRYVGASQDPKYRLWQHMVPSVLSSEDCERTRWLKSLKADGLKPILLILEQAQEGAWEDAERRWIAHYQRQGARLTNIALGGQGNDQTEWWASLTEEQRQAYSAKMSAAMHKHYDSLPTDMPCKKVHSLATREKQKESGKRAWADPVKRASLMEGIRKGMVSKKSKAS